MLNFSMDWKESREIFQLSSIFRFFDKPITMEPFYREQIMGATET